MFLILVISIHRIFLFNSFQIHLYRDITLYLAFYIYNDDFCDDLGHLYAFIL